MQRKNIVGMLAGYYLSRFDLTAYDRFPATTQSGVHEYIASKIGVPASSVKLWRDEFDPIHSNTRKGWHKRKMAPSRLRMSEMLAGVSEKGVYVLLCDCLNNPETESADLFREINSSEEHPEVASTRGITGLAAEELFIAWFETGTSIFRGTLADCRQLQCGYDFEAIYEDQVAKIEVKGLKGQEGGVLLTDKEWNVANESQNAYFLVLFRSVQSFPRIEVFQNPASKFTCLQRFTTVVQVSWTIQSLDSMKANCIQDFSVAGAED